MPDYSTLPIGGHTSESLMMLSALDFNRYSPRTYVVSDGDSLSGQKAIALERLKAADETLSKVGKSLERFKRSGLLTLSGRDSMTTLF